MSNYREKEIQGLFDYTTGEFVGVLSEKGREDIVLTAAVDPVSGLPTALSPDGMLFNSSLLDYSQWSPGNAAKVIAQLSVIYNPKNVSGSGIYRSGAGVASSSGTTVTVDSTKGLAVGMRVAVIGGTGLFNDSNAATTTEVQSITNPTQFVVTRAPTTPLSGATVYACKVFKLQTGPNHLENTTGSGAWEGCTYMPNGKGVFNPVSSTNIGIFDPQTLSYFRGPAHGETASAFAASTPALTATSILRRTAVRTFLVATMCSLIFTPDWQRLPLRFTAGLFAYRTVAW